MSDADEHLKTSPIDTAGGAAIMGNVDVSQGGTFVGRDQVTVEHLTVQADQLSLDFLRQFLISTTRVELLGPLQHSASGKQAKDLAFGVYTRLKDVDDKTTRFVEAFANFIQALGQSSAAEDLAALQAHLQNVARDLLSALPDLAHALDAVNPQLEVYQYDLVQKIEWYQSSRARVLSELEEAVATSNALDARTLAQIQTQALENQRRIHEATGDLRSFLAREFSFKESF